MISFHSGNTKLKSILPFPLQAPENALTVIAIGRDDEKPHASVAIIVQVKPTRMAGFRPKKSEARPQRIAVQHWASEKTADVIPAHFATSAVGIPKLSIISGCSESV